MSIPPSAMTGLTFVSASPVSTLPEAAASPEHDGAFS
jgi:hypothetical protein